MTIAISLKVNDGIVLAADSASTLIAQQDDRIVVRNVFTNANKIFNLYKGLPIGAITWGAGSIGQAAISTLAKDFRNRIAGHDANLKDEWMIDPSSYQIADIAQKFYEFMFQEQYETQFADWPTKPLIGFIIAGFSTGEGMAEEYQIDVIGGKCSGPYLVRDRSETGFTWEAQTDPISRLILGVSERLPEVLRTGLNVPEEQIQQATQIIQSALSVQLLEAAMPIQDAIDLARFLVDLTINYSRFAPGPPTVGGPIEIAAITKHEGFKWISRKHYYEREFNPEG